MGGETGRLGSVCGVEKPPKPRFGRARNAISSLLLIAVVSALVFELRARRNFTAACDAVDRLMASHHHHASLRSEVEAIIRKMPDGPLVRSGMELEATYTWRGLRAHILRAYYLDLDGKGECLVRFEVR